MGNGWKEKDQDLAKLYIRMEIFMLVNGGKIRWKEMENINGHKKSAIMKDNGKLLLIISFKFKEGKFNGWNWNIYFIRQRQSIRDMEIA